MLTQDDMVQIIKKHTSINLTKATLTRYQKSGFVFTPVKTKEQKRAKGIRRVIYPQLTIVEFITAYLLFFGDWLTRNSKIRIGRCTDEEIRYGRMLFYSKNSKLLPKEMRKEWKEQLKQYDEKYAVIHPDMPASFIKARRQYLYELYQSMFWHTYGILKEDIKEKEIA